VAERFATEIGGELNCLVDGQQCFPSETHGETGSHSRLGQVPDALNGLPGALPPPQGIVFLRINIILSMLTSTYFTLTR
jgi:hypothetical protein